MFVPSPSRRKTAPQLGHAALVAINMALFGASRGGATKAAVLPFPAALGRVPETLF